MRIEKPKKGDFMRYEKFYLSETNKDIHLECMLYTPSESLPSLKVRPAVVVCPGGGYGLCSDREADPIAMCYSAAGYHVFILRYSIKEDAVYPNSLVDLCHAMKLIRDHAEEWGVDKDKIAVCGFSAGGHLCCGAATRWTETLYPATDTADTLSPRPDFALLIYPAYLDEGPNRTLSPDLTVNAHTPPLFVFGTQDDKKYSSTSCINILKAMQEHDAPIEIHYLTSGGHGYGMQGDGAGKIWPVLAQHWLKNMR